MKTRSWTMLAAALLMALPPSVAAGDAMRLRDKHTPPRKRPIIVSGLPGDGASPAYDFPAEPADAAPLESNDALPLPLPLRAQQARFSSGDAYLHQEDSDSEAAVTLRGGTASSRGSTASSRGNNISSRGDFIDSRNDNTSSRGPSAYFRGNNSGSGGDNTSSSDESELFSPGNAPGFRSNRMRPIGYDFASSNSQEKTLAIAQPDQAGLAQPAPDSLGSAAPETVYPDAGLPDSGDSLETIYGGGPFPPVGSPYAGDAYSGGPYSGSPYFNGSMPLIGVPNMKPGWQFHAGLLYLQPSADNLGWGILTNEKNYTVPVPVASPYWAVETLSPGYAPGVEVGGGYTFVGTGRDVQFNYQHLRTSTGDAAATNATGEWISPFSQTGPPTADSFDEIYNRTGVGLFQTGTAQVKFAYDSVNMDFGQYVSIGRPLLFRLFAGLSYARLQERLYSNFYGVPPASTEPFPDNVPLRISLDNTSNFWGIGPRFGFDSSYQTRYGWRLTSQLAGALLIGQTQPAQYVFTGTAPGLASIGIPENHEQISSPASTNVVWTTSAKLGVGYTRALASGHVLNFEAGYLASIYLNPFSGNETNENILGLEYGALSSGSIRHIQQSNFTLNGFYLSAGVNW